MKRFLIASTFVVGILLAPLKADAWWWPWNGWGGGPWSGWGNPWYGGYSPYGGYPYYGGYPVYGTYPYGGYYPPGYAYPYAPQPAAPAAQDSGKK